MAWARRLGEAFGRGPRLATAALMLAGAGLAGWSAARSVAVGHLPQSVAYLAVCVALLALMGALAKQWWVADVIALVILLGSVPGSIAAAVELVVGVDPAKADEVRSLGVQPGVAVAINLAYFLAATAIALWLVARLWRRTP